MKWTGGKKHRRSFRLPHSLRTLPAQREPQRLLTALNQTQLAWLQSFGFDLPLFESWQKDVAKGRLSAAKNVIDAALLPPPADSIADLPKDDSKEGKRFIELGEAAIRDGSFGLVILNGGMATRFGGVVKGVVPVLGKDKSFIGLRLANVRRKESKYAAEIPVYFMNSFATDEATKAHLKEFDGFGCRPKSIGHFTQFVSARMNTKGQLMVDEEGEILPYGPGHGDFAPALRKSGCLQDFLDRGGKTLFVSNVDNLGAKISPMLIGMHLDRGLPMTVEVAPKWPTDVGGAPFLVLPKDVAADTELSTEDQQARGRVELVEQIRFPEGFDSNIVDVFNTNTFTFDAKALDRDFDLTWCYVEKTVKDKSGNARKAVQIERLIGELSKFLDAQWIRIRRCGDDNRFFPVKTPDDLDAGREEIAELYAEEVQK